MPPVDPNLNQTAETGYWDNHVNKDWLKFYEKGMEQKSEELLPPKLGGEELEDVKQNFIPKDGSRLEQPASFTKVDHDPSQFTPVSHDPQQFTPVPWDPFTQTLGKFGKAMAEGTGKLVKDFIDSGSNQTLTENDPTGRGKTVDLGAELAFNLMGSGTAFIPEKAVGMFGGKLSAVMQSPEGQAKLKEALGKLKGEGMTKEQLWEQYGLFTGADGKLRFEIPDTNAKLNFKNFFARDEKGGLIGRADESSPQIGPVFTAGPNGINKLYLKDVLDHPELYKHYPDLADMEIKNVSKADRTKGIEGSYFKNSIELTPASPSKMRSTLLHEVQHAIQEREGFARGGNPQEFESKTFKDLDAEKATREKVADNLLKNYIGGTNKEKVYKAFDDWSMNQEKFSPESLSTLVKVSKKDPELYNEVRRLYLADNVAKRYRAATTAEYRKLAGEVESNNVEFRDFMSRPMPDEWWMHDTFMPPPWQTEGVNRLNQIILQQGESYVRPRK